MQYLQICAPLTTVDAVKTRFVSAGDTAIECASVDMALLETVSSALVSTIWRDIRYVTIVPLFTNT